MELRKINKNDAKAQWEYTTALPTDENGLTNPYNGVSYNDYMNKVLPILISYEHPVNMPDWFVPETYYYLWDEGRLVGEFRIRHHLTEALKSGAGHIGYSIRRDDRGKGYATEGLKLTLQEARKIIPEDEIYLRVNKDNIASQKVMQKNGGKIVGEDEGHFFVRIPKNMQIDDYIELYKNGGYIKEMRKYVGHAPILTCACGVIIENARGEILLQKRQDNGCWAIIGGSMEMGETFEETVRRETMEESGLTLGKLEVFKLISGRDRIIEYPNGDVCFGPGIVFITSEYEGSIVNDPEEVMEHRFFKRSELPGNLNRFDKDIILDWANRK